jgi:26S proteasome regulatory subunit N3
VAKGFVVSVNKWLMVIRLLLGEIPERIEFQQAGMHAALQPYLQLTAAVRSGDVTHFKRVVDQYAAVFAAETTNLISRLHHNVIRAGLRRIAVSYSKISLKVRHTLPYGCPAC